MLTEKLLFQNRGLVFLLPSETPPPPGLLKDHTFYGFFSGNLPLELVEFIEIPQHASHPLGANKANLSTISTIATTPQNAVIRFSCPAAIDKDANSKQSETL